MRVEPRSIELVPTITNAEGATLTGTIRSERDDVIAAMSVPPGTWVPSSADVRTILGRANRGRVTAVLAVETAGGEQVSATAPISVRREVRSLRYSNEVVNDSTIERFRLIFFDYDAPTISAFNRDMVDLVRSRIRTTSSLRITGLTDRIGPADRNRVLSLARAQSIDAAIRQRIVPERVSVRGAGAELIYNNNLPEGRLYNRTVLIEVATPIDPE
jgi:outer membrane protein OmpA-like peptidoglycan-associated protein